LAKIVFKGPFRALNPIEFFKNHEGPLIVDSPGIIEVLLALKLFQSVVITPVRLHFYVVINPACFPDFLSSAVKRALHSK